MTIGPTLFRYDQELTALQCPVTHSGHLPRLHPSASTGRKLPSQLNSFDLHWTVRLLIPSPQLTEHLDQGLDFQEGQSPRLHFLEFSGLIWWLHLAEDGWHLMVLTWTPSPHEDEHWNRRHDLLKQSYNYCGFVVLLQSINCDYQPNKE